MIYGAVYLLYMFQKVFFGKLDQARNGHLQDLNGRELGVFIPLVIAIFAMGLFPRPFLKTMEPTVAAFVSDMKNRLGECDGPPHRYGELRPTDGKCVAAPAQAAQPQPPKDRGVAAAQLQGGAP